MDEFLICENPLKPEGLFVLKTSYPKCLIECDFENEKLGVVPATIYETFTYVNTEEDIENWRLSIVQFYDGVPNSNKKLLEDYRRSLAKIWDWFHDYLLWDENNMNEAERNDFLGSVN